MLTRSLLTAASGIRFAVDRGVVSNFAGTHAPFGFNGLGELVYRRTYSRPKANGENEQWHETVERVVNGTFSMQKRWAACHGRNWDEPSAQRRAADMYTRMFLMKFLPPGRGLWAMGSSITEDRGLFAALNNCGFVSTAVGKGQEPSQPYAFLMDASMLGIGVGFDTSAAGQAIPGCKKGQTVAHVVEDSREGWVAALEQLMGSHMKGTASVKFDYSRIRPAGTPIAGFGGVACGPEILAKMLDQIAEVLERYRGKTLDMRGIVDIMNMIGCCVVSGNVRRSAEISFGPATEEYMALKNYSLFPERAEYGWASNNSIFAEVGMDYSTVADHIRRNGEPGLAWLENMRKHGRMNGKEDDFRDHLAMGGNPCMEQTLEPYEMCCLVETFPARHDSLPDYLDTLSAAFEYAKTVTLGPTHWALTNDVMQRNRRIGCSMSGVAQFLGLRGWEELRKWCEGGYAHVRETDRRLSRQFGVCESIKTTSIKPSGTVSLLAGATSGMHFPESRFYLRRVRLSASSPLIQPLREANLHIEPAETDPTTMVVSFPIDVGEGVRTLDEVSMWEQLSLAAFLQRHWADNQVSCTVTFKPEEEGPMLKPALEAFQHQLKSISFLPRLERGAYKQMPLHQINAEQYAAAVKDLKLVEFGLVKGVLPDTEDDKFCDGDKCVVPIAKIAK